MDGAGRLLHPLPEFEMNIKRLTARGHYTTIVKILIFTFSLLFLAPMTYKFLAIVSGGTQTLALEHVFVYCLVCCIVYMAMRLYHIGVYLLSFSLAMLGFTLIFIVFEASKTQKALGAACLIGAVSILFLRKTAISHNDEC